MHVATVGQWIEGARLRTLPAAVAPVLVGTGLAAWSGSAAWGWAGLALVVALALQVGVNYANDYSDGIRGTDDERVGPMRLVGSGAAKPGQVKAAAFACFGLAALAGLILAATTSWWLIAVGALAILAAWYYTGGARPYGYLALGEVMVFIFFGVVAVVGTAIVQLYDGVLLPSRSATIAPGLWWGLGWGSLGVGALACAILVANNLRDIPTDKANHKITLAVLMGGKRTRWFFIFLVDASLLALLGLAAVTTPWVLLAGLGLLPVIPALVRVYQGAVGPALIPVLQATGVGQLAYSVIILVVLLVGR